MTFEITLDTSFFFWKTQDLPYITVQPPNCPNKKKTHCLSDKYDARYKPVHRQCRCHHRSFVHTNAWNRLCHGRTQFYGQSTQTKLQVHWLPWDVSIHDNDMLWLPSLLPSLLHAYQLPQPLDLFYNLIDHCSGSCLVRQVSNAIQRDYTASVIETFEPDTIQVGITV